MNISQVLIRSVGGEPLQRKQQRSVGEGDVNASNDCGTAGGDNRHFIDSTYLCSLPGGQEAFCSMVPPTPPCKKVNGCSSEGFVCGQLASGLSVGILSLSADPGATMEVELDQVLVVNSLPVPLHISTKRLGGFWSVLGGLPFDVSSFPGRYQTHAYWSSTVINLPF